jgi:ATP-dependent Clp endopeptidase proteolytic subunit ClpP
MHISSKTDEIWVTKFDEDAVQKFRDSVIALSKTNPQKPITIYIDSYGGAVDALAAMIETLDTIPNTVITVAVGKAMSCGAILLSHGDVRFCGPNSRVMIHEVSSGTIGDVHDMKADTQEAQRLNSHFMGLLARNCGFKNYDEIRKLIKAQDGRDRYLNANEAVEFGIVDVVGMPLVTSQIMYEINVLPSKPSLTRKKMKGIKKSDIKQKSNSKKST